MSEQENPKHAGGNVFIARVGQGRRRRLVGTDTLLRR
jgi:hypothetical protein